MLADADQPAPRRRKKKGAAPPPKSRTVVRGKQRTGAADPLIRDGKEALKFFGDCIRYYDLHVCTCEHIMLVALDGKVAHEFWKGYAPSETI